MAAMEPMAMFGLEVPCGDVAISARGDIPAAFRITMAAIDPSAEPEGEDGAVPRATLKIIRHSLLDDDSDEEDYDMDDEDFDIKKLEAMLGEELEDEEDSEDDEDVVGGPSDPAKSKKARKAAALREILAAAEEEEMDEDEDDVEALTNGKSPKSRGKMPVEDAEDDEDSEEDSDDEYGAEIEEFVICTLDPTKNFQQALDITIGEDERVLFKVSGTHSIFLTGNYVEPAGAADYDDYDSEEDSDEDYDLEPGSDEELYDSEEDELDDLEDPRVMEIDEEEEVEAPQLVKADKKGKNKRAAEDDEAGLDALISQAAATEAEKPSKKQAKKQKKNDGTAAAVADDKESSAKKVQFAKNLEQGPTPTKDTAAAGSLGVKKVQGVTLDDKKLGSGPAAKPGDRVSMRYIGKLEKNGKVFDANKKGKPFSFKLGAGEVIKGWDIGIKGMAVGGERRLTIPAHLAYGSKATGDIPANSTLVFDVKCLDISRK